MQTNLTPTQLKQIIKGLEFTNSKIVGTRSDNQVIVSLREDSQATLLQALCDAINQQLKDNIEAEFLANIPSDHFAEFD